MLVARLVALLLALGACGLLAAEAQGARMLSDARAAALVRPAGEHRPENADENRRVPTRRQLRRFFARNKTWGSCHSRLQRRITGDFTGTTDEILQWAAHKWGFPVNLVRAMAVTESYWQMSFVGDRGDSFGIAQVRRSAHHGTIPVRRSTAFNVDYWGAHIRQYLHGCADWMHAKGRYRRGDLWGSVGAWFSGSWYDRGARRYIARVRAAMVRRPWNAPGF